MAGMHKTLGAGPHEGAAPWVQTKFPLNSSEGRSRSARGVRSGYRLRRRYGPWTAAYGGSPIHVKS